MHPCDINAAIHKRGSSQQAIAREFGISINAVNNVVWARGRSRRLERAIARITHLPPTTLWPQWYGESSPKSQAA